MEKLEDSAETDPKLSASASSMQNTEKDQDVSLLAKSLQEETLQISELIEMERNYSSEIALQLKQIIQPLNLSYHIKPDTISKTDASITDAILTPQGIVCVFSNAGTVITKPVESFQSEVIMRILKEVIPEAKALMNEKRQKLSGRVVALEKVSKELRKMPALSLTRKASQEQPAVSRERSSSSLDAMKSALGEKASRE